MRLFFLAALLLSGCTTPQLPFEKATPVASPEQSLIAPPWTALVKAGPGAEKDLDMETLNGTPDPSSDQPLPPVPPKPGATVVNAVAVLPIANAPELARAMRKVLSDAGWPVIERATKSSLTIQGKSTVDAPVGNKQMVHLVWVVSAPDGKLLGNVAQNNAVPAGSLSAGWGANAEPAAQAAGEGISKLIQNYR